MLQIKRRTIFEHSGDLNAIFRNFASISRGVGILLNNNFEFKVQKVERDEKGNRLILTIEVEGRLRF